MCKTNSLGFLRFFSPWGLSSRVPRALRIGADRWVKEVKGVSVEVMVRIESARECNAIPSRTGIKERVTEVANCVQASPKGRQQQRGRIIKRATYAWQHQLVSVSSVVRVDNTMYSLPRRHIAMPHLGSRANSLRCNGY